MTMQDGYSGWSEEQAETDSALVDEGGKADYFKPKVGTSRVRFLPAKPGGNPMVVTYQHYVELPGKPKVVFTCPRAMPTKQPCPVCAKVDALMAKKNKADRDLAYSLKPRLRVYANVLDRDHPEKGPMIWGFGKTIYEQLKSFRADPDVGDFFRPDETGFDIIVQRKGTTKNDTEYFLRPSARNAPLGDMAILDLVVDNVPKADTLPYPVIVARLKGERPKDSDAQLPAGTTTSGVRTPAGAQPAAAPSDPGAEGW